MIKKNKVWGFKDPRASILLPIWKKMYPNYKVIICLRNPMEVAFSLAKRISHRVSFRDAIELWNKYYKIIEENLPKNRFIVTHYESYFYSPCQEISRITKFCGLESSEKVIKNTSKYINKGLYRADLSDELLFKYSGLPDTLQELYDLYKSRSGTVYKCLENDSNNGKNNAQNYLNLLNSINRVFDRHAIVYKEMKTECDSKQLQIETLLKIINSDKMSVNDKRIALDGRSRKTENVAKNNNKVVSIIIPIFNQLKYTKKCLQKINRNKGYQPVEIIVVDNASYR